MKGCFCPMINIYFAILSVADGPGRFASAAESFRRQPPEKATLPGRPGVRRMNQPES